MELENQNLKAEKHLPRKQICSELLDMYGMAEKALGNRGVKISFTDFTSYLVSQLPSNTVEKFIETKTPPEYLVKEMLNDPMYKDQILAFSEKLRSSKNKR